jgi:D-alanyl-D-alanine dipeptidase
MVSLTDLDKIYLISQTNILDHPYPDCQHPFVRETIKDKIANTIDKLPEGYSLLLEDAYRPYDAQKELFDKELKRVDEKYPDKSEEEREQIASTFVSNPDQYSPHVTGAAIDVAILDKDLKMLDVGNFFDYDESAHTDYSELTDKQQENRNLLISLMEDQGFVNYPYEWWHWSCLLVASLSGHSGGPSDSHKCSSPQCTGYTCQSLTIFVLGVFERNPTGSTTVLNQQKSHLSVGFLLVETVLERKRTLSSKS